MVDVGWASFTADQLGPVVVLAAIVKERDVSWDVCRSIHCKQAANIEALSGTTDLHFSPAFYSSAAYNHKNLHSLHHLPDNLPPSSE